MQTHRNHLPAICLHSRHYMDMHNGHCRYLSACTITNADLCFLTVQVSRITGINLIRIFPLKFNFVLFDIIAD